MSLLDDIWSSIVGNAQQQQAPPPPPPPANYGLLSPQTPSWEQYRQDINSPRGILGGILGAYSPAIGRAVQPDSLNMPAYNAALGQSQPLEIQRLGIPKAQAISGVFDGSIDPATGLPVSQGAPQGQPPQIPQAPQVPGAPAAMPQSGYSAGGLLSPQGPQSAPSAAPGAPGAPGGLLQGNAPQQAPAAPDAINRLFGIPTPGNVPTRSAFMASQLTPDLFKAYATGQNEVVRGGSMYPNANGQRTFAPIGEPGVSVQPGQPGFAAELGNLTRQQEGIKQTARVAAEKAIANKNYTLQTGDAPPPDTGSGGPPTMSGPAPAVSSAASQPAPASTLAPAPQSGPTPQAAAFNGQPFVTDKGTNVPAPRGNQVMGPGSDQIKNQLENSQKVEANWDSIRPTIESARDRLTLSSQIFAQLEGKGLNEQKAIVANTLRGTPLAPLADYVMSAKDTAGVQSAIWNSMQESLSALKAINAGTGGRILNSEFNAFMEHGYSPDMVGSALHTAITHQLGQIYQTQNMIDDFGTARQMNWRDASQYQRAYLKANPVEGFVSYAAQTVPQFKGMGASGPSQEDLEFTAKKYNITTDEVKQRLGLKNGQ